MKTALYRLARPLRSPALGLACAALALGLPACDRRAEDYPEWKASEHDHQDNVQPNQFDSEAPPKPGMPSLEKYGINQVTLAAWKANCVSCHGLIGAGDGPQGAMMRARDLTDPQWQKVALDEEIARSIKKGRGRMPAFPQLPDETVTGLVRLIRLMNPAREEPAEASAEATTPTSPHATSGATTNPHALPPAGTATNPHAPPTSSTSSSPHAPSPTGTQPPSHP